MRLQRKHLALRVIPLVMAVAALAIYTHAVHAAQKKGPVKVYILAGRCRLVGWVILLA